MIANRFILASCLLLILATSSRSAQAEVPQNLADIGAATFRVLTDISERDNVLLGFQGGAPIRGKVAQDKPVCFLMLKPDVKSQVFYAGRRTIHLTGEIEHSNVSPVLAEVELLVSDEDPAVSSVYCSVVRSSGEEKPLTTTDLVAAFGRTMKITGMPM
jgi:hypothetical protein